MSGRGGGPKNPYRKADRFTVAAKEQGYAARSVFKLSEIQQRFKLLRPGQRVLDLGCAPGSWLRYAAEQVGRSGAVVGIDFLDTVAVPGATVIQQDLRELDDAALLAALGGRPHLVLSDMAPRTTGNRLGDHVDQLELAYMALGIAQRLLEPGGHFCVKVFEGEDAQAFVDAARRGFAEHKRVRPEAVRGVSREFFLVCKGYTPSA